jgi:isoamylase
MDPFNPAKLIRDPYARAVSGVLSWHDALFGYVIGHTDADLSKDDRDSAPYQAKCMVIDEAFSWGDDTPPHIPWDRTIIYEVHVKGFSKLNPKIPQELRGTYAGLASPEAIDYFLSLGITAVELMPVHQFVGDRYLTEKGLSNYWGYNSVSFFAPHAEYSHRRNKGHQVADFKTMVKTLHREGIEVILDVVYNHTGEGNQMGPTLCLRGIDNPSYYRLVKDDRRYYMDYTGTGNTLNMMHPRTLQLIMDSLRYWVTDMHVDGFRFDLASALARELHAVNRLGTFFDIIHQDPVLSQVKLIAEPWDVGEGGYQVGNFPILWTEWNGMYRDTVRSFWKGDKGQLSQVAYRLTGSSDLYATTGRRPYASINFITAHDGFTLLDLVSYNQKHNEANGEENRDGTDMNLSWNCGVEGPTDNQAVLALRDRQQRNFLATLLFSQGVPMLRGGDEIGQTKKGNNNTYCQDNEVSWLHWDLDSSRQKLLEFTRYVIKLRRLHPVFRRSSFFRGRSMVNPNLKEISWFRPDCHEMTDGDWNNPDNRCLGMLLAGDAIDEWDERGNSIRDDTMLVLFNAGERLTFRLPNFRYEGEWEAMLDTRALTVRRHYSRYKPCSDYEMEAFSLALFCFRMTQKEED